MSALIGPCQVTRTWLSSGDVPSSTARALWSPATWDCAATPTANAAASAMPIAGSNHRTGRRRPRAAASISGANQPFTLWSGPRGTSHDLIVARTRRPTACRRTGACQGRRLDLDWPGDRFVSARRLHRHAGYRVHLRRLVRGTA